MSSGIGLAAILSDFVPGAANFQSFMFGSIVAIPDIELYTVVVVSMIVIVAYVTLYKNWSILFLMKMERDFLI